MDQHPSWHFFDPIVPFYVPHINSIWLLDSTSFYTTLTKTIPVAKLATWYKYNHDDFSHVPVILANNPFLNARTQRNNRKWNFAWKKYCGPFWTYWPSDHCCICSSAHVPMLKRFKVSRLKKSNTLLKQWTAMIQICKPLNPIFVKFFERENLVRVRETAALVSNICPNASDP